MRLTLLFGTVLLTTSPVLGQSLSSNLSSSGLFSELGDPTLNRNCADCELNADSGPQVDFLPKGFAGAGLFYLRDEDGNQERFRLGGFRCGRPSEDPKELRSRASNSSQSRMVNTPDAYQEGYAFSLEDRLLNKNAERLTLQCEWVSRGDRFHNDSESGDEFTSLLAQVHFLNESGGPLRHLFGKARSSEPSFVSNPQPVSDRLESSPESSNERGHRRRLWLSCEMAPGFDTAMTPWLSCTLNTGPGFTTLTADDLSWKGEAELSIHSPSRTFGKSALKSAQFEASIGYLHRVYAGGDDETDRSITAKLNLLIPISRGYLETSFQGMQIRGENSRHTFGEWDRDLQYAIGVEFVLPLGRAPNHGSSR